MLLVNGMIFDADLDLTRSLVPQQDRWRDIWLPEACDLRREGWRCYEIGQELGVDRFIVATHLPGELLHLDRYELAALREFDVTVEEAKAYVAEVRAWREAERRRRAIMEWKVHPRWRWGNRDVSIDQGIFRHGVPGSERTRAETIPDAHAPDPLETVITEERTAELESILAGVQQEDIGRLDEHTLQRLRDRLKEAGFAPGGVRRAERDRLSDPVPHHGKAAAPMRGRVGVGSRSKTRRGTGHGGSGKPFKRKEKQGWRGG